MAATWTDISPVTSPPKRRGGRMDWNPDDAYALLFGGITGAGGTLRDDTWTLAGGIWTEEMPDTVIAAREEAVVCWDGTRIIVFGGAGSMTYLNDTQGWIGGDWVDLSPATSPDARFNWSACYTGDYVLMFGGFNNIDGALDDTWKWDGSDWEELFPVNSPDEANTMVMASDQSGETILCGESPAGSAFRTFRWDPDTPTWDELSPATSPSGRQYSAFVWTGSELVLFGGNDGGTEVDDTWVWDSANETWVECSPTLSPSARDLSAIAYSPAGPTLFGGDDGTVLGHSLEDTWRFTGTCLEPPPAATGLYLNPKIIG